MKNKKLYALIMAIALVFAVTGCNKNNDAGEWGTTGKGPIYATIAPVYDLAKKIAGEKQTVELIVTSDIHDYEPSAADMAKFQKSSMIIYNGLELDSFVNQIDDNLDIKFVDTSMGVERAAYVGQLEEGHREDDGHDHSNMEFDPHIWMSPLNAKIQLENIKNALCEYDPINKRYYEKNYEKYAAQCDELDAKFKELSGMNVVTTHNAYTYLQKNYNINIMSMDAAGDGEISPAKMKEIVEYCNTHEIKTIYTEEGASDKTAQAVATEIGGVVKTLNSYETVVNGKDDYFMIMQENYEGLKG